MERDEITFVCISDTHNYTTDLVLPPGDVLIHAGDFTTYGFPNEVELFNSFLAAQNFKYKVVIAGNHDLTFDIANYNPSLKNRFHSFFWNFKRYTFSAEEVKSKLKDCIYLEDSSCEIFGYKIYGTPWTPIFHRQWAFSLPRGDKFIDIWKKIPSDTDILITHGPPSKILDLSYEGKNAGCEHLFNEVTSRVKPLYHIFGHIHEGYGVQKVDETTFVNASTCTKGYKPTNKPIVFTLPRKK